METFWSVCLFLVTCGVKNWTLSSSTKEPERHLGFILNPCYDIQPHISTVNGCNMHDNEFFGVLFQPHHPSIPACNKAASQKSRKNIISYEEVKSTYKSILDLMLKWSLSILEKWCNFLDRKSKTIANIITPFLVLMVPVLSKWSDFKCRNY